MSPSLLLLHLHLLALHPPRQLLQILHRLLRWVVGEIFSQWSCPLGIITVLLIWFCFACKTGVEEQCRFSFSQPTYNCTFMVGTLDGWKNKPPEAVIIVAFTVLPESISYALSRSFHSPPLIHPHTWATRKLQRKVTNISSYYIMSLFLFDKAID